MATPPSTGPTATRSGIFHLVKDYLRTWVDVLRTRLDLVSTELEEEQERIGNLVLLGATSMVLLSFGLLLLTFLVVAAFWDTAYRLAVVGGLALLYLAVGVALGAVARRRWRAKPRLLSASLNELAKDYQRLSS